MIVFRKDGQLEPDVEDALYELSNVGVGKATSALANMMGERVTIQTPKLKSVKKGLASIEGVKTDKLSMGILMRLGKGLGGAVLIIVDKDFMSDMVRRLTGTEYSDGEILEDELSLSAIQEVANIMAASYMTAIGAYTGLRIYLTPVMVGVDVVDELISYTIRKMLLSREAAICIDTSFAVRGESGILRACDGNMIVLPDEASIDIMMRALFG